MHKDTMKPLFGTPLALAALVTLLPSCEQPKANCTAGVGGFAVTYKFKEGSKKGNGACDALKGETIGLVKYNPLDGDDKTRQDLTKAFLVIRTSQLGALSIDAESAMLKDDEHDVNSVGDFVSSTPDDNNVCSVPELTPAEQKLPAFTKVTTEEEKKECNPDTQYPATDIKYEWSNIRLYVTAAYPGTQMVGDLTYTENDCTASYSVTGLWPVVSCRVVEVMKDADGNPVCDATGNPITTSKMDPALCDPVADPEHGRPTGSGINPDLKERVKCDDALGLCVLTEPPPELK